MKNILLILIIILNSNLLASCNNNRTKNKINSKKDTTIKTQKTMKYNTLTSEEKNIIENKGTEYPFTGKYWNFKGDGIYICKKCNSPLYNSKDKFESNCGWPSFDDEIEGAVSRKPDADGRRIEILCNNCGGHLGHVFEGEGFTDKNIRHCVNSISLQFISKDSIQTNETVYFAGGCFWGVEYFMQKYEGVKSTSVGYMGGTKENPTYKEVCLKNTGHAEVVEVVYDKNKINFEDIVKLFFEIHDFTQVNRQGPDIGDQYRTEIFYTNNEQKVIIDSLINILKNKGFKVATKSTQASKYWIGEDYHQDYYNHNGNKPYCHSHQKIF